jgi:hypothetical protein
MTTQHFIPANNTWLFVGKARRPFTIEQGAGTGRSYTSRPGR